MKKLVGLLALMMMGTSVRGSEEATLLDELVNIPNTSMWDKASYVKNFLNFLHFFMTNYADEKATRDKIIYYYMALQYKGREKDVPDIEFTPEGDTQAKLFMSTLQALLEKMGIDKKEFAAIIKIGNKFKQEQDAELAQLRQTLQLKIAQTHNEALGQKIKGDLRNKWIHSDAGKILVRLHTDLYYQAKKYFKGSNIFMPLFGQNRPLFETIDQPPLFQYIEPATELELLQISGCMSPKTFIHVLSSYISFWADEQFLINEINKNSRSATTGQVFIDLVHKLLGLKLDTKEIASIVQSGKKFADAFAKATQEISKNDPQKNSKESQIRRKILAQWFNTTEGALILTLYISLYYQILEQLGATALTGITTPDQYLKIRESIEQKEEQKEEKQEAASSQTTTTSTTLLRPYYEVNPQGVLGFVGQATTS